MTPRLQRGASLVVAIFVVVIIAALAAFAVASSRATRDANNLQLLADRALAAAREEDRGATRAP